MIFLFLTIFILNGVMKQYKCRVCKNYLEREEYDWYTPEGKNTTRHKACKDCEEVTMRGYEAWEARVINKKEIQDFLSNLRKVTGIYTPEDLIKKHRKW
jgi:NAD-dependent SIR2 family protein deacetylase